MRAGVLRAGITALVMGGLFMLAMATVMWTAPAAIVGLFIDAGDPANAAVVACRRHVSRASPRCSRSSTAAR